MGQTKSGSQAHHGLQTNKDHYIARIAVTGTPPWSQGVGAFCPAQPKMVDVGPPSSRLTTWDMSLDVVCVYGPNSSTEYLAFLESLGEVLDSAPTGDSIVLLGDFNAQCGQRQ
ncbi:hypothetical protein L3Q82_001147 [Scortum barcoo]|uniref:Uncharacterized protein n=1 Tax=Scortum barcoo TaxID=214431 RepID=A0ACB8WB51_9TELE|nr:hypothetical protein L3Q82_001147 [Scortum barcoo]